MIGFEMFTLENGLRVMVHEDKTVQIAVMNILYDVGSRDERPDKTGFAHLFEHLMFGGSMNIPDFDGPLERVGGENNAFTSADITNYYLTVPASNIETGFWLESDRMLGLSFDDEVLANERKVVIEEFKQNYLNRPYGDVWLKLRPLAYKVHPYQWATIGKEPSHIEGATMRDVRDFFSSYYVPNNATLVVAGNVSVAKVRALAEKWFGPIPKGNRPPRMIPREPVQREKRTLTVHADVPADALYKVFHIPGRFDKDFYPVELMSDILSGGKSSRLYNKLVKEQELFTSISSFTSDSIDPGLLIVNGRIREGVSIEAAEEALDVILKEIATERVTEEELEKVKNQTESMLEFEEVEVINRAMNLAFGSLSGDPDFINKERSKIEAVTREEILRVADTFLKPENESTMYYLADRKK